MLSGVSEKFLPRPTDAELSILRVLWRRGPSTVRQTLVELGSGGGYTTVLKLLQIMTEKGLVTRDERERTHVYSPAKAEEITQRQLLDDLLTRAFGGSAQKLVMQALAGAKPSQGELSELRNLLDSLERKTE
jgi:predicted transcriptional regulator